MTRRICRHCQAKPVNRPRGLCWVCYYTAGVRDRYPPTGIQGVRGVSGGNVRVSPASFPTAALPGTAEKVDVMAIRARLKQDLWHPEDERR